MHTFIMGDALIVGRGGGSSSKPKLETVILVSNSTWTVPKAKDQKFSVRIFGGGGCGGSMCGGGNYYTHCGRGICIIQYYPI